MTDTTPTPEPDDRDPLAEAESIINDEAARAQAEAGDTEGDALDSDLSAAEAKAAEHFADLQRLQAEFVNYRKRVERDREAAAGATTAKVVEQAHPCARRHRRGTRARRTRWRPVRLHRHQAWRTRSAVSAGRPTAPWATSSIRRSMRPSPRRPRPRSPFPRFAWSPSRATASEIAWYVPPA
ncbi:hypothetical protein GCM10025876_22370 [Demequina litorisediminis]|uniref:Nucleotide exchange factor GrpE n=1 Tax=Demequina litorisediminis TaxID=1849022 RepID=A0ABQ6IH27_9MICO|nr:hypothetical protein GCM10025876_22370 [Demequina litorisediminis]